MYDKDQQLLPASAGSGQHAYTQTARSTSLLELVQYVTTIWQKRLFRLIPKETAQFVGGWNTVCHD